MDLLNVSLRSLLTPISWNILCNFEVYSKPQACWKQNEEQRIAKGIPHMLSMLKYYYVEMKFMLTMQERNTGPVIVSVITLLCACGPNVTDVSSTVI